MAELVSIKRNVDVSPGQAAPAVFHCSQGDVGSKLILGLLNNGTAYSIPSGVTVTIEGSESNGSIFTPISATASGSDITFYLTGEMTAVAGPAICQAVLKSGSNILGTANFTLEVESSPMGADAPPVFTDAGWTWMLQKLTTEIVPALGDNIVDAIDSKADQSDLTALSNTVAGHTGSITVLNNTVNTLNGDVTENRQNIALKLDKNQGTANAGKYLKVQSSGQVVPVDLIDNSLLVETMAADSKATGDALNTKLNKNQGANNSGKYLKVGADGNVENAELDVTTDKTLSIADKAADAKAVGDELDDLKADLNENVANLKSALDEVHIAPEATTFAEMIDSGFQIYSFEDVAKVLPMTVLENIGVANGKFVATNNYDCYIFLNPYYGFTFGINSLIAYLLNTMPAGISSEVLNGSPITGVADGIYKQYTVNAPKGSIVLFEYAHAYPQNMQTKLFNHYTAKGLELDAVQDAFLRYAETGADTAYIPITVAKATGKIINTNTGGLTSNASYDTYYFNVPVSNISVTCKNGFRAAITTKNPSEISTGGYYVRTVYEYESGRVNTFAAQMGQWVEISVNVNDYPSGIDLFTDFVKSFTLPTLRLDYGQKTSFYKASINGSAKYLYIYFTSGSKLVQWELHNVPAQASNSNTWQIGHVMGYDFDGVTVSNGAELVGGGEFELAFKEHGAVDYCGGNNHGDETTDAFVLHIDGKQISDFSALDGEYHVFDRIEAIEIATVNRCNTPSEDILKHKKTWVFENGHVTLMQTIKYLETLQVDGALFTMFAANRSAFEYGIRQGATDVEDMTAPGYTHIRNRSNHVCYTMYGADACANIRADVIDYTGTAELWINDTSDLNKLYYELYPTATSANPVTVQNGSVVSIVTDYDVSYS